MPSSPAVPRVRLGPRFAAANDVDRDVEEALGLMPEPEDELEAEKGVDEEIDELLSETEEQEQEQGNGNGQSSAGPKDNGEWGCRWEGCWRPQENQDDLVEHLQTGMPLVYVSGSMLTSRTYWPRTRILCVSMGALSEERSKASN
jgi:hypothetical protein